MTVITEEEKKQLEWLEENQDLIELIQGNITYSNFLKQVERDQDLSCIMNITATSKFIEFIKDNQYAEVLKLLEKLVSLLPFNRIHDIEYLNTLIMYVQDLIEADDIHHLSVITTDTLSSKVLDALLKLRTGYVDSKLAKKVEDLANARVAYDALLSQTEVLTSGIHSLEKEKISLSLEVSNLRNTRSTLFDELGSLKRQIEVLRVKIEKDLLSEEALLRKEMQEKIVSEGELQKSNMKLEISNLTQVKEELMAQIRKLKDQCESLQGAFNNGCILIGGDAKVKEDVEVEWVSVTEEAELYNQNHWTFGEYYKSIITKHSLMTGKSMEEAEKEIIAYSKLNVLAQLFEKHFNNAKSLGSSSIKLILNWDNWDFDTIFLVERLKKILSFVKLPKYTVKKKSCIEVSDNVKNYLEMVKMQIELNQKQLENEMLRQEINKILLQISGMENVDLIEGPTRTKHI